MARIQAATLRLSSAREVLAAGEGDHTDGGGLMLRIRGTSATFVLRFTTVSGKRREMGAGVAYRGNLKQAGESVAGARNRAAEARALLGQRIDPIDERAGRGARGNSASGRQGAQDRART